MLFMVLIVVPMIVIISQGSIKMDSITDINQFIKKNSQTSYNLQNFYDTLLVSDDPSKYIYRVPIDDFFIKYKDQLKVIQVPYHLPEDIELQYCIAEDLYALRNELNIDCSVKTKVDDYPIMFNYLGTAFYPYNLRIQSNGDTSELTIFNSSPDYI